MYAKLQEESRAVRRVLEERDELIQVSLADNALYPIRNSFP